MRWPAESRQDERLGLAPHLICLAVGTDERGAPGWLETLAKPLRGNRPRPAMGDGLSLHE